MTQALKQIEPPIWGIMLEAVHDGSCVPFLGAAANVGGEGFKIPTGVQLARDLVRFITGLEQEHNPEDLVKLDPPLDAHREMLRSGITDLARVSLHLRDQIGAKDFLDRIRKRLIDETSKPSPLLRTLAELPFELIVTTNYDSMMEAALAARGRACYRVVQPLQGFAETEGTRINTELENFDGVRLYKIHGEFPAKPAAGAPPEQDEGEVSPIIITEEDYIQFLTVFRTPLKGVPSWVESKITTSRFLFLGYGLEDWDFRTLYEGLIAPIPKYNKPTSYAIQWDPPSFWVNYWDKRGVRIYNMDVCDFAEQLRKRYVAAYGEPLPQGGG